MYIYDILLSGPEPLAIPFIPPRRIKYHTDGNGKQIPLLPFLPLILLKIQGWIDRQTEHRPWMRNKVPRDEQDLRHLLQHVRDNGDLELIRQPLNWLEGWFVKKAESWVEKYVDRRKNYALDWAVLGLPDAFNNITGL